MELVLNSSDKSRNERLFQTLHQSSEEINGQFGETLSWLLMPENKISKILISKPLDGYNPDEWGELSGWIADRMSRLQQVMEQPLATAFNQGEVGEPHGLHQ